MKNSVTKNRKAELFLWRGIAAAAAAIYWGIYCFLRLDLRFFNAISGKFRLVFLFALIAAAVLAAGVLHRIFIERDLFSRKAAVSFLIHAALLFALFIFIFPGCWAWDDIGVLRDAKDLRFNGWQHFLTSLYMILCLYFIPSPGGATAVQLLLIALFTGWITVKLEELYFPDIRFLKKVILRLPFLAPPVLLHDYLFFRSVPCAYLEICLLLHVTEAFRKDLKFSDTLIPAVLTVILASWRTENIYYAVLFALFVFLSKVPGKKHFTAGKLLLVLLTAAAVLGIGKYNNRVVGNNDYSVLASSCPAVRLYRSASATESEVRRNSAQLEAIGKVLDTDMIEEYPNLDGAGLYWEGGFIRQYTPDEYSGYLKALVQLAVRYPKELLAERMNIFINSLGMNGRQDHYTRHTVLLFRDDSWLMEEMGFAELSGQRPAFRDLRERIILFLGCLNPDFSCRESFRIVWNVLIPIILLLCGVFILLSRKRYPESACAAAVLLKVPILFASAPSSFFMYYLTVYLAAYLLLACGICSLKKHHR